MANRVRVPFVLQMENVECGAASLAMIIKYYGKNSISLEQLRIDCAVSRDGVSAKGIKLAAIKNGLKCNAFKANEENIKAVRLPAIIHWNMGHFVVLCGFSKKWVYINDPALGRVKIGYEEFNKSFTGIVLTFEKGEGFAADKAKEWNSFTLRCVKPFLPQLLFVSFLITCVTVFNMIYPFINSAYIENILLAHNRSMLGIVLTMMLVVIFLTLFANVLVAKISREIEKNINIKISLGFMEKLLRLPVVFFSQRTAGELANRQLGSFETAQLICIYVVPIFFQIILAVLYCGAAFVFNVYIALIGVAAIILNILSVVYSSSQISTLASLYKKNSSLYQSNIASAVEMIETVKACACERAIFARLAGTAALNLTSKGKLERLNVYTDAIFSFINSLVSVAVLIVGVYEIFRGNFSIGIAVGVLGMVTAFLVPVGFLVNSVSSVYAAKTVAERTDDTMKYKQENIFLDSDTEQTKAMTGKIIAENVSFCYPSVASYAVRDISFCVEEGGSLALVGFSGSGKSTIGKLISGLYAEKEGHIYYGEAKKSELKKEYFFSALAIANQSVKIYDGTIFDNITMWDNTISYDDVVLACRTACIHKDIVLKPNAYFEKLTENGKNLSGGQRQRLEIARALVRKPKILIMDEATSALDAKTESEIMQNIKAMGITLVIIAHRLSTIRACDEILVIENGEIAERGNHDKLIELNGLYKSLVSDGGE